MYIICGAPHCTYVLVIITQDGYRRKGGIDGPMDSATALNVISLGVHTARLPTLEECEYRCIDLLNALQLYPVPTARKNGLAEIRDELLHPFDPSARTHHFKGGILVTP